MQRKRIKRLRQKARRHESSNKTQQTNGVNCPTQDKVKRMESRAEYMSVKKRILSEQSPPPAGPLVSTHRRCRCGIWSGRWGFEGGSHLGSICPLVCSGPHGQALQVVRRRDDNAALLSQVHSADAPHWCRAQSQKSGSQVR